jgi:hypothetical protein
MGDAGCVAGGAVTKHSGANGSLLGDISLSQPALLFVIKSLLRPEIQVLHDVSVQFRDK